MLDRRRHRQQRRVPGFHLQDIGDQIAMQQHRALGDAGGAAGILQESDIVGPDGDRRERQRAALLERCLEADGAGQRIGGHHLFDMADDAVDGGAFHSAQHVAHAGDHDVFNAGARQRRLQHRGEILQHENGFGAGIVELEFQLARLVQRVDVHHRHAGAQDGGDRHRILQHVRHHDGDARAALQPAALQPGGKRARGGIELGIGQRSRPCRRKPCARHTP